MRWLSFLCLIVVLRIPVAVWQMASEHEREMVRTLTIQEHCLKESKKTGVCKFRVWERIFRGNWELHIIPIKTEV